jgi:hypothetical protein
MQICEIFNIFRYVVQSKQIELYQKQLTLFLLTINKDSKNLYYEKMFLHIIVIELLQN